MRAAAPLAGVPVVVLLLQQDPGAAVRGAAAWLLGRSAGPGAGLAVALVALTLAAWAAPRVTAGLGGWPRHLPVSQATHRRAALVALATAQAPVGIALLLLAPLAAREPGGLDVARLVALPLIAAAAAVAAWPGTHGWRSRPVALLALAGLAQPGIASLLAAPLLVVAAERLAGPLAPAAGPRRRPHSATLPTPLLIAARALGPRALLTPLLALLPVGAMTLLRLNNDLAPGVAAGAARLGGGLGVAFLLASLAERLAERRPVWPWARSLPAGARRRVAEDAATLAFPCLVPLLATAWLDPLAALTVAACVPLLAFRAAGALRGNAPATHGAGRCLPRRGSASRGLGRGAAVARGAGPGGDPARLAGRFRAGPSTEGQPVGRAASPRGRRSPVLERAMIELTSVRFGYDTGAPVLDGLDLRLGPGLTLLVGPNGCGKSTLLKLVAGVERPDQGTVAIHGLDLWRDEEAARRPLAYVPEHPDLSPYASLLEVLRLVCRLRGEPMERATSALAEAGLAERAQASVRELSAGQRRRALLAAAWVGAPKVVLLDEPLESLDRGAPRPGPRLDRGPAEAGGHGGRREPPAGALRGARHGGRHRPERSGRRPGRAARLRRRTPRHPGAPRPRRATGSHCSLTRVARGR